ncbi:MAG: hypothetical protein LBD06_00865 [Candidatus Accumulibacter sp.]|nr:hypothetical protein [Accumulibacter sp.]
MVYEISANRTGARFRGQSFRGQSFREQWFERTEDRWACGASRRVREEKPGDRVQRAAV